MSESTSSAGPVWLSLEGLKAGDWPDRPRSDEQCQALLDAAHEQLVAYAPLLVAGTAVPARYKRAVALQVRELWAAAKRDSADTIGLESYAVRVRPLSSAVRQLLRPPTAVGFVG